MTFVDFLLVEAANAGAVYLFWRFALPKSASGSPVIPTTLTALGQIISHDGQSVIQRLDVFEEAIKLPELEARISTAVSKAGDDLLAKLQTAAHTEDTAAVQAATEKLKAS